MYEKECVCVYMRERQRREEETVCCERQRGRVCGGEIERERERESIWGRSVG